MPKPIRHPNERRLAEGVAESIMFLNNGQLPTRPLPFFRMTFWCGLLIAVVLCALYLGAHV